MTYLIKRLIAIVPALLLLSLLIFVLKTAMPEGVIDRYLNEALLQSGNSSQAKIDALSREIRADLKLDLPIFYFSIRSAILPDSIYRMYPVEKAEFYQELLIKYGCASEVNTYYRELERMMNSGNATLRKVVDEVYFVSNENQLDNYFKLKGSSEIEQLSGAFYEMSINRSSIGGMAPTLKLHGVNSQFHFWLLGIITLDFGHSIIDNATVISKVGTALVNTLSITVPALALLAICGIPLGIWLSGGKSWSHKITSVTLFGLDAMPMFWLSLILIILFSSDSFLNILPAYGMGGFRSDSGISFFYRAKFLVLPVTALVVAALPYVSMQVSKAVSDESQKLYVISARSKGLSERRILWVHILRNSLVPMITIFSEYLTSAFAGSLIVEVIFSIPGMGKLLYDSVLARDYNVVLGIIIIVAFIKMMSNILADVSYRFANPSINY